MSAQPIQHTRAPRAHRDATPVHMPRHVSHRAWHARAAEADATAPDFASAQTVFYVARGLAVLLAAVAIGLGAASDETEQASTARPTSSHATTH